MAALAEELKETGYRDLTIEGVAKRAGVNKSTIYRRWGSVEAILLDSLLAFAEQETPVPDTGSLAGDLLVLARAAASISGSPEMLALIRAIAAVAVSDPGVSSAVTDLWERRLGIDRQITERAIARGELPEGTDTKTLIEAVFGPMIFRLLMTGQSPDDKALRYLINVVCAGAAVSPRYAGSTTTLPAESLPAALKRRQPVQSRSKETVERILSAAGDLIAEIGAGAISARLIAERAGMPASTLYRYFENSDSIVSAFLDRELETIGAELVQAVLELETVNVKSLVEAILMTSLRHHEKHPSAFTLWFDPRNSNEVKSRSQRAGDRLSNWLDSAARSSGLIELAAPAWGSRLIVRMTGTIFQIAFEDDIAPSEREEIVSHFVDMVVYELDKYATVEGKSGIRPEEFIARLGTFEIPTPSFRP